jgi:acyl transferase domain-containing protein
MSKIAFIFPGQGAQTTGMGQDFYQETETGRGMFEKASEILGFSMTDLCFDPEQTDRLNITEYTQPAMVVMYTMPPTAEMPPPMMARNPPGCGCGSEPGRISCNGSCRRYV